LCSSMDSVLEVTDCFGGAIVKEEKSRTDLTSFRTKPFQA